jgi:hypothetical protein
MSICLLAEARSTRKLKSDLKGGDEKEPDEILFIKRGFATISYWGGWN